MCAVSCKSILTTCFAKDRQTFETTRLFQSALYDVMTFINWKQTGCHAIFTNVHFSKLCMHIKLLSDLHFYCVAQLLDENRIAET